MNVRQKLSLAALCIALPALATAQAAPAPAAEPAAAPAAAPAPAFESKLYGFLALTYVNENGTFAYPEYAAKISSEAGHTNSVSARQSRIGWNFNNADAGVLKAKLSGRLEFDFMGNAAATIIDPATTKAAVLTPSGWDSALPRLRYAYATANWDLGPGKLAVLVGQTDGLVNSLHPELGANLALPTFLLSGNLTRRSPQVRAGYSFSVPMVDLTAEVAALNAADKTGVLVSAGNTSGMPDFEGRLQAVVKPMADVKGTVGVGYHTSKKLYNKATANQQELTTSLIGVDVNVDATKWVNVRGEWFTGKGSDEAYTGVFGATSGTAGALELVETSGYWVQGTVKLLPALWVIAGYGATTSDQNTTTDTTYKMMNVGVLSNVGKNWRLGLEYSTSSVDAATDLSGNSIALSSRFTF